MNKLGKLFLSISLGLILIAGGILTAVKQDIFLTVVTVVSGIIALIEGFYTLANIRKWKIVNFSLFLAIMKSVFLILLGSAAVYSPFSTARLFATTFIFIFAFVLLFSSFASIQNAIVIRRNFSDIKVNNFILEIVVDLVLGVFFLINPTKILDIVLTVIGIMGAVTGVAVFTAGIVRYSDSKKNLIEG